MDYRHQLFHHRDPYDVPGTDALFLAAVRENCLYQAANCPPYARILRAFDFSPRDLRSIADLSRLPVLPTAYLKRHHLFSMPRWRMPILAASSGTSGAASQIGLDLGSLTNGLAMVLRVMAPRRLVSPQPCHYVVFGYRPHPSNHTAIAKTAFGFTCLTPAVSRTYALRYKNGAYEPDLDGVIRAICTQARSPFPTRFIGFPAYTYFTLTRMEAQGLRVRLPAGSKVMLGGGWKQFYREAVDKTVLYCLIEKIWGIPEENVIESYGAAEHPILYCDCPQHHFHVPIYSRVLIRDVHTLEPLPPGRVGLVNLITPMVRATPILSVMTDDLGILHDEACPCGVRSPYLEILGRVGMKEVQTCAAGAAALLAADAAGKEAHA